MAKYTITHSCGHDQVHDLFGKSEERDRKESWLGGTLCAVCYHAKKETDRAAANATAAEEARSIGLAPLAGSEKQVAWAESIRVAASKAVAATNAASLDRVRSKGLSEVAIEELGDAFALLGSEVMAHGDARWWIDNRDAEVLSSYHRWAAQQVETRGLTPTFAAECQAAEARRLAEKAEREERERVAAEEDAERRQRAAGIFRAAALDPDTAHDTADGEAVEVTEGEVTIRGRRGKVAVLVAGEALAELSLYQSERWDACLKAATSRGLAGISVVSAVATSKRSEPNLTVTLSDGSTIRGDRKAKAITLETQNGWPLDPNHPEVLRIAAEAAKVVTRG